MISLKAFGTSLILPQYVQYDPAKPSRYFPEKISQAFDISVDEATQKSEKCNTTEPYMLTALIYRGEVDHKYVAVYGPQDRSLSWCWIKLLSYSDKLAYDGKSWDGPQWTYNLNHQVWCTRDGLINPLECVIYDSHNRQQDSLCIDDLGKYITLNKDETGNTYKELTLAWLANCHLRNSDISQVITYLRDHSDIKGLFIGEGITSKNILELAKNVDLYSLSIHYQTEVGDAGAAAIAANPTISELSLIGDNIGSRGAAAFAKNTRLRKLELSDNSIGDAGASDLAKNKTLKQLEINRAKIGDAGASEISKMNSLNKLSVMSNRIGSQGAVALARNSSLSMLYLTDNKIGDDGAIALAKNSHLATLMLNFNAISDKGAVALAQNTTLTSLSLGYNNIKNMGAISFSIYHPRLSYLDIVCNQIGELGIYALLTLPYKVDMGGNPGSGGIELCQRMNLKTGIPHSLS